MKTALVTKYDNKILYMLFENKREVEIDAFDEDKIPELGNIYVARVRDTVPSINSAFVETAPGRICYLNTDEKNVIFLNKKNNDKVCQGDLLLVQVSGEAVKTKAPSVTCELNLHGRYVVLDTKTGRFAGVSKKIKNRKRAGELKNLAFSHATEEYGFIIRTDAETAADDEVLSEMEKLAGEYRELMKKAMTRNAFTLIRKSEHPVITCIHNAHMSDGDEIITDDAGLYDELNNAKIRAGIKFYDDAEISLARLYSVEERIKKALSPQVWLKSGGYLVIEPTEALTVIDVNTGKYDGRHKDSEEVYLKINMEAADEIARQLRLRNISGMVIVDFINMKDKSDMAVLAAELKQQIKKDGVHTVFVDFTALGLAEITRQKKKRPLYEIFG